MNCQVQPQSAIQKRSLIFNREFDIQRKFSPSAGSNEIQRKLDKVLEVKKQLLTSSGLNTVSPVNDGTFEEDVILTDIQSNSLLNSLRRNGRKKRSILFGEEFPNQMWSKGSAIPYTFDVSLSRWLMRY